MVKQSVEHRERGGQQRLDAYLNELATALGHADREDPFRSYCFGLLLDGERKSVEPMAARLDPEHVQAKHQSLHHFVAQAAWSDTALLEAVHRHVVPALERHGPITAWIVDDTGIPKKGRHSVGVARQYCGQRGKQDNCQVAVTLSLANEHASLPVAWRLYLPEAWAGDAERRIKAGVPPDITFQTKPRIALDQIRAACAAGLPRGLVLTDAGYGNDTEFRTGLTALGLIYAVGIQASTTVWAPGTRPLPPKPWSGKGRRPTRLRRDDDHKPVPVTDLARSLPASQWRSVTWREGTNTPRRSRFASVRVPAAHRDDERAELRAEEWLLIEWPDSEAEPTQYWLSTLPADTALQDLVAAAKGRWRIERDYEELKQEIGLGHYEGRGWRGFHHHATLCIAAYGFLIAERCLFPPRQRPDRRYGQVPALPATFRPRGAGAAGTP
jgi:SRSO17 transposase